MNHADSIRCIGSLEKAPVGRVEFAEPRLLLALDECFRLVTAHLGGPGVG
jgi:hypothetical protein